MPAAAEAMCMQRHHYDWLVGSDSIGSIVTTELVQLRVRDLLIAAGGSKQAWLAKAPLCLPLLLLLSLNLQGQVQEGSPVHKGVVCHPNAALRQVHLLQNLFKQQGPPLQAQS